ncbi:MAG TPA: SIMPL domain-containing protein [Candidatus Nitrosotenuis sp.]|nr:SIMPL domain-containing protein [Candidatus Nitrosotenuis sp.]
MNKTLTMAAAAGIVLVMAFAIGAIPSGSQAQAQTEPTPYPSREKTISVSGTATATIKPDLLNVQFGVEVQKPTAKEALDANTEMMNKVVDAIKGAGITESEISTAQFSIYPVYESYQEKETGIYKQKLTGYNVSNIIKVKTTKLDLVSNVIDAAVAQGVNRVDSVFFSLSPDKQKKLSDDLLSQAIENARTRAENALSPLDYQIVGVKSVILDSVSSPPPMPYYYAKADAGFEAARSTPVFSSDQDVSTSASVIFLIGSK